MKQITEITRRDIFDLFINGIEINGYWENKHLSFSYYGQLSEIDFLKRIYDLKALPSFDDRFEDAEGDIWQHAVNNDDYEEGWIFKDDRFELLNGEDDILLKFLCSVFHPAVRDENGSWKQFIDEINRLIRKDGYELYPESKISGRDVFAWREYRIEDNILFVPYSQRHENEIKRNRNNLSLPLKLRRQIYKLLEKYTETYRETDENGCEYVITTDECVFSDISQFYEPKYFEPNGKYIETTNLEKFILKNYPYYVFDVIEIYQKYNPCGIFTEQINVLFKMNSIPYKLNQGRIEKTISISIDKRNVSEITERGLKELIDEAERYRSEGDIQIAVEKIWDAFERLKSYYCPLLNKSQSANKIIDDMGAFDTNFKSMYEAEFKALTAIGNSFRIRHHETTKVDITDNRQYDYFYNRCLALISLAIQYL